MDQEIRNKLRNVVTQCRKLLEEAIAQELEGKYGIFAKKDQVTADPNAKMGHLTEEEQAARKDILDHFAHINARGFKPKESLDQLVREIAFTHLNRLCAYKMMEAREVYVGGQKFREAVSRGVNSNGVKFYLAEHPDDERLFNTGHQDVAYRHFLDWLGGALSDEIGVLFNPNDPANRLYPRQKTLEEVLDLLNGGGIKVEETEQRDQWPQIWSQDETIGWVYQYFTPKELRDKARKESAAPRNSYELAFRNQFFTPRYVVEFLTDNTLGRIWYEMRRGDTKLKDQCRYMVRRPTEIFLKDGKQQPKDAAEGKDDLSQEELLKLPVHIPHRSKKDPRELKILDPACGSGHFLLYCFDLLLTIYEEAYADPDLGPVLKQDYPTLDALKQDVPRLILAHNLHGIDIDLRASQIAALALWLRCQRAYKDMGLTKNRPKITRSNFVCAEPMPGEEQMLKEFVGQLEPKVLGQVVEVVFDKMRLAGEAGSLLKIEEEIRDAVAAAKKQYVRETTHATDNKGRTLLFTEAQLDRLSDKPQQASLFDVSDITDEQFFEQAEVRVIDALRNYAEKAHNGQRLQRRLFSEDAVRGFAFVDVCSVRYDVSLMNPPFGEPTARADKYLRQAYADNWKDLYAAFLQRQKEMLVLNGTMGAITASLFLYTKQLRELRQSFVQSKELDVLVELGDGVLDTAMVEVALTVRSLKQSKSPQVFTAFADLTLIPHGQRDSALLQQSFWNGHEDRYLRRLTHFQNIAESPFCYHMPDALLSLWESPKRLGDLATVATGNTTFDNERFIRLRWECSTSEVGTTWFPYEKGGDFHLFFSTSPLMVNWANDGNEMRTNERLRFNTDARSIQSISLWFRPGLTYPRVSSIGFGVRVLPKGHVFSAEGISIFPEDETYRLSLLAFLNSTWASDMTMTQGRYRKTENRAIKDIPIRTEQLGDASSPLAQMALSAIRIARRAECHDETSAVFVGPVPGAMSQATSLKTLKATVRQWHEELSAILARIDEHVSCSLFGDTTSQLPRSTRRSLLVDRFLPPIEGAKADQEQAKRIISWCVGCAVGRWDRAAREYDMTSLLESDPFSELPDVAPAMLAISQVATDSSGQPAGLLVDDPEHSDDVCRRVQEVLESVWHDNAEMIEKEAATYLGSKTLRDYFRKPGKGGFWDDHISRYSKSRRNAPIYWLLQSAKKNYAIWLYYHRLDKDMLFKALVNYVEPKIRLETSRLETLRSQIAAAGDSGKEAKRVANEAEKQEDFLSELRDFEDKLRRAANLHLEPDLNDGVVLNIAPLHELVPWKEAKKYWDELLEGQYEWSSIGKQLRQKGLVK